MNAPDANSVNAFLWVLLAGCVVTGALAVITVFTGSLTVGEGKLREGGTGVRTADHCIVQRPQGVEVPGGMESPLQDGAQMLVLREREAHNPAFQGASPHAW